MIVQHVLVPIDFSPYAEQALDYAIALAQKLQACVILLHVIQPPLVVGADMGAWPSPAFVDELEAAITRDIEGYLARVTAAGLEGEIAVHLGEDGKACLFDILSCYPTNGMRLAIDEDQRRGERGRASSQYSLAEICIPFTKSYDPLKQRLPPAPNWRGMCSAQH